MDLILHFRVITDFCDEMIKKNKYLIFQIDDIEKKAWGKFPFVQALVPVVAVAVAPAPTLAFDYAHASVHVLEFAL